MHMACVASHHPVCGQFSQLYCLKTCIWQITENWHCYATCHIGCLTICRTDKGVDTDQPMRVAEWVICQLVEVLLIDVLNAWLTFHPLLVQLNVVVLGIQDYEVAFC